MSSLSLVDGSILDVDGTVLWSGLPAQIGCEPGAPEGALFLTAQAEASSSRLLFGFGSCPKLAQFSACHRYEAYWMRPAAGERLRDVPAETQSLLVRLADQRWLLLVPLVDTLFRFSLRGNKKEDALTLVAETGDAYSPGLGGLAVYVAVGADPFELARTGAVQVNQRLGAGKLRRAKPVPKFADDFGWCTWDAFYQEVSEAKVRDGLERFRAGGVTPRFLILDDGWQSVARRATGEMRLTSFAANEKFPTGLMPLVKAAKADFGVRTFLVWHAVVGYWGGVDEHALPGYGVVDQTRQHCEGVLSHEPNCNQDWWGNVLGLVPADHIARFYDDYHRSLRAQGVDGVKVDSQAVLEAVSMRQGGRIALTRAYRSGLEASVARHFDGNLINCMSNAQETWYFSPASTLLRTSIDFFPTRPELHGAHLYANAQVGLWFGEFMQPDWDMFQSGHAWGAYHAAARALSGGPVYASDKPGVHDFELLKKLVCADGSVLRCESPGLPTLDVLCRDPTREDVLMKIWNRNGVAGFVGAFNARVASSEAAGPLLSGTLGPLDVPALEGQRFACYFQQSGELLEAAREQRFAVSLGERGFELCSIVPIERGFAAVGLADKFNSRGAVIRSHWVNDATHEIELRDGGVFLAFAERAPRGIEADGREVPFEYEPARKCLRATLDVGARRILRVRW